VNNDHLILADEVLGEMRQFVLTVDDSGELDEFVLEIVQGIRKKVWVPNVIWSYYLYDSWVLRHP
jgi:hypothetical protein